MKNPFRITIKFRLHATAISIFLILIIIGLTTNFYVRHAFKYENLLSVAEHIENLELQLRKSEKNFLLTETINPAFFETKQSPYVDSFVIRIENVQKKVQFLQESPLIRNQQIKQDLRELKKGFSNYEKLFFELVETTQTKGFKDYGLVGQMRDQIHAVEDKIKHFPNNKDMNVHMLMLRRHEKDYLLRKDLKYRKQFDERAKIFATYLTKLAQGTGNQEYLQLVRLLKDYRSLFFKVIALDEKIGLDHSQGLHKELSREIGKIERNLKEISALIEQRSNRKITQAISALFAVSLLLSVSVVLLLMRVSNHIIKYLKFLKKYITRLGRGELPQKITPKKNDEIAEMIHSINNLTQNLRNTRDFAIEVGNGNLQTQVNVFENKGDLGGSLVEMRNRLYQVAQERQQNEIEAKRRSWITEGIARFAEILRQNNDNMEEFAYAVLSHLIAYLDMNQGGFFIINDDDPENPFFELKAAIAYGRRKFQKKRIVIGEDLVGQAIQEKRTIYLTEVPENYISITSGLGKANPRVILIVPLMLHDQVLGVIEIASFGEIEDYKMNFIERVGKDIATTISTVKINQRTVRLLERSQEQAQKLHEQEEELRQNVEELRSIQDEAERKAIEMSGIQEALHATFLVVEYDMSGTVIDVNDTFLKFFGLMRHQFVGKNHSQFTVRNKNSDEYRRFWSDLKKGISKVDIQHVKLPNGNEFWLSETYTPIYGKDSTQPHKVINIALDITESKRQEQIIMQQKEEISAQEEELRQNLEELKANQEAAQIREEEMKKQLKEMKKENKKLKKQIPNEE